MFKAINRRANQPIISLDSKFTDDYLRSLGSAGDLECAECRSRVRFRRESAFSRRHFVHDTRRDCLHDRRDARVLAAQALLYDWLTSKFPNDVQVDYRIPHAPHQLDPIALCVVRPARPIAAYWLYIGQVRDRLEIKKTLGSLRMLVTWIGVETIDEAEGPDEASGEGEGDARREIDLPATHRDFVSRCRYDMRQQSLGSLRFVDLVRKKFVSYRDLELVHAPQRHVGRFLCSPVCSLLVHRDGEICHPGEKERLVASKRPATNGTAASTREQTQPAPLPEVVNARCKRCGEMKNGRDQPVHYRATMECICRDCSHESRGAAARSEPDS